MAKLKVTKEAVKALEKPIGGDVLYWDNDPGGPRGFGVPVTKNGVKSFIFQFRLAGRTARRVFARHRCRRRRRAQVRLHAWRVG